MHLKKDPELSFKLLNLLMINFQLEDEFLMYSGRYAFFNVLKCLNLTQADEVLLPSYHCLSMVEPVLRYGCGLRFYKINKTLETTLDDLRESISPQTKLVVLVHYFGHYQKHIAEIKQFLTLKNIYLFEDCAHILPGGGTGTAGHFGKMGDFTMFSPRKFLPVVDGAILKINLKIRPLILQKLDLLREIKAFKNDIEVQIKNRKSLLNDLYFAIDTQINKRRAKIQSGKAFIFSSEVESTDWQSTESEFNQYYVNRNCSRPALFFLKHSNFKKIFDIRKNLFKYFDSQFYQNSFMPPPNFYNSSVNDYLLGFPLLAKNRTTLVQKLKEINIQTFTFGDPVFKKLNNSSILPPHEYVKQLFFIPLTLTDTGNSAEFFVNKIKKLISKNKKI